MNPISYNNKDNFDFGLTGININNLNYDNTFILIKCDLINDSYLTEHFQV